jgi:RHH-type proline utilization regulon transcriptional repressor/proline dehydrogenase/delta 1-pyrroline-5-carboxylate dehydrogenase
MVEWERIRCIHSAAIPEPCMPWFKKTPRAIPRSHSPAALHDQGRAGSDLAARTLAIGTELLDAARSHKAGLFSARFYSDKLMDWSMKDQGFKVQLFRFVDVFPMLTTPEQVFDHLADYLAQPGVTPPPGMDLGLKAGGLLKGTFAKTISGQIRGMAEKFIAGTDAASALPRLAQLWKDRIAFSVDLLGEACLSDAEADEYAAKYLDLITNLPGAVGAWAPNPTLESDHLGPIPRCNVSIKISSLSSRTDPIDPEGSIRSLRARLDPILRAAHEHNAFINFDMEQFALKDLTIELFKRCASDHPNHLGIAIQAYLKSGDDDARDLCRWARDTGRQVSVRLIKGAYWDYETIHAEQMGWPCPVWNEKWQTDACFERMADIFLDACPRSAGEGGVKLALGSHNARSIARTLAALEQRGLPGSAIELQMLHGMADQLKYAAADRGLRVREYVPVGELIPGMAYLVRRLLENTSNESWLKAGFLDNADPASLLADPASHDRGDARPDLAELAPARHALTPSVAGVADGRPFFNEPFRNFAVASQREAFAKAVARVKLRQPPRDVTVEEATRALGRAEEALPAWRDFDPVERAEVLVKAANAMRRFRDDLAAEIVAEAGKPWREADADVCEAIDFCDYYARLAPGLFSRHRVGRFIGELDETLYQPRGVCVVISPWNFPLAICAGMTAAAIVTGNTVLVKPAEQSPRIAHRLTDMLREALLQADAPQDALQIVPGPGETVGAALVRDPRTAIIAFTGSKAVGLNIIRAAAETPDAQFHLKKVIAEMGGKNAIIIDTSADLDEAVVGVRYSAFGFSGQKCSACSRCIVVDPEGPSGPHITRFTARLVEAARALVIAPPTGPSCDIGPVIDDDAAAKIRGMIEAGLADGATLLLGDKDFPRSAPGGTGVPHGTAASVLPQSFIPPHIFANVLPTHRIAREEIFGPVLAIMHAQTFDDALRLANDHPYKLTGGLYSRMPAHIERAKRRFRVGNLYINRGCTGALVARHPFGGFGLSGTGSKAGGSDYLLHFVEPRAVAENTMRRGFAPEL